MCSNNANTLPLLEFKPRRFEAKRSIRYSVCDRFGRIVLYGIQDLGICYRLAITVNNTTGEGQFFGRVLRHCGRELRIWRFSAIGVGGRRFVN